MNRTFSFKQGRSRVIFAGVCSLVCALSISAQVTSVKLPKADSSASFQVLDSGSAVKLRLNGDGGFYAGGKYGTGVIPATGAGPRMMWYPAKAAFRAGYSAGTLWDDANVGGYSTAMGYGTVANNSFAIAMGQWDSASGQNSVAIGSNVTASSLGATAMGYYTVASGAHSTAIGFNSTASGSVAVALGFTTTASGSSSTAMGGTTTASGQNSTAMGAGTTASGIISTAMGINTTASGSYATAMGSHTLASGDYSTAMGSYVSTNSDTGAFIIGDFSTTTTTNASAVNQMTMRFANGYRLFTNSAASIGVSLAASGNSWTTISDSTKKTNFQKADHDYFLSSLAKLKLGSWNYKSQDAKNYRHYGPMAQEIFHYFGHDGKGTIGCDTLLASADMDGIMMICLQALEKRTGELQKANEQITELKQQVSEQKAFQQKSIAALTEKIERLSQLVYSSSTNNREQLTINTSKEELR